MSTHNVCFYGEIRKISVVFGWKSVMCGQQRPQSDFASAQSDLGLCCPSRESSDTIECINGELWLHVTALLCDMMDVLEASRCELYSHRTVDWYSQDESLVGKSLKSLKIKR